MCTRRKPSLTLGLFFAMPFSLLLWLVLILAWNHVG